MRVMSFTACTVARCGIFTASMYASWPALPGHGRRCQAPLLRTCNMFDGVIWVAVALCQQHQLFGTIITAGYPVVSAEVPAITTPCIISFLHVSKFIHVCD